MRPNHPITLKKVYLLLLLPAVFFIVFFRFHHISSKMDSDEEENDMYDGANVAQQFEVEKTKDPSLGYVPVERLYPAYETAVMSKQRSFDSRTNSVMATWVERGPNADVVGASNGNSRDGVNQVASGRIRAIWVDLSDASGNTVWVGGIGGGLWKTTNFKSSPATWTPINDFFTNLSIGSICQDPTNNNIMYFGTGEKTFNTDAIRGVGVWKSTDHGVTWNVLAATTNYFNVSKVLCDASGNLYVGTIQSNTGGGTNGFFRSTNGGTSFTNISPSSPVGISTRVSDFVISSTGKLHLSLGYYNSATPGYKYASNPATVTSGTWTAATTSYPVGSTTNVNCVLACKGDTVYALPSDNTYNVTAIYRSTDGGAHWAATASSPPNNSSTGFCSGQGWYCLAADVNPTNANNVIIGSLDCYSTTDGGATWNQISDWVAGVGATGQYVHADQQIIKWYAANEVLIGNDGGIFYSSDQGSTFNDRNNGLRIKQFYSCDFHPSQTDYFIAGAQDNGCHQFSSSGMNTTTEVTGGDGGNVHIDQQNPLVQIGSYTYNNYRLSTDGGTTWNYYNLSNSGKFINPTDYDNTNKQLYGAYSANNYSRWDPLSSPGSLTTTSLPALGGSIISTVTVSPHITRRVYFGTDVTGGTSKVIKCDSAHGTPVSSDITGTLPTSLYVSCVAVGPNASDNDLIVTYSSYDASLRHVFYSTNGGTTWTNISGNLPDMPVRWAIFDPASNTKAWIATETGVWSTTAINGASTVWTASPGFPTVRTDMIKYRPFDQTLVAATHGRGLWTESLAIVLGINDFVLQGKWNDQSALLSWNYSGTIATSFDIESSTNGVDFTKAGTVSGSTYTFLNPTSLASIYYRIKSVSILGVTNYSNVIIPGYSRTR